MKRITFAIAMVLISTMCQAAPKAADAKKWLSDFRSAREKTSDALFLNDRTKSAKHTQVIMALRDRANKVFGQTSDCTATAEYLVSIWTTEIEIAIGSSNPNMAASSLTNLAWEAGQNYAICRDTVDSMK